MQSAAIDWHVWQITQTCLWQVSAVALGAVGLTKVIPTIVLSLFGGVAADRHDNKRIMFLMQSLMAFGAGLLAITTWTGTETLWLIYAMNALNSAASAFDNPARQALIPRLVPREALAGAVSLNLSVLHLSMIAGPALFCLIALGSLGFTGAGHAGADQTTRVGPSGLSLAYALNAASFLAVIGSLFLMRASGRSAGDAGPKVPPGAALKEGLSFVFSTPIMVWTMALDFFATLFSGAMSMLPIFADKVLGVGTTGYALLRAAPAVGAFVGSVGTSVRSLPRRQGPLLLWSVAGYAIATIVWGLSRSFWLTFAALALTGFSDLVSTVIRQTLRQLVTPDRLRGRMTGVNMIFFMGGPQLGELEAGLVAACFATPALGATVSVVSGGVITLLVVAFVAARSAVVRNYDVREHLAEPTKVAG